MTRSLLHVPFVFALTLLGLAGGARPASAAGTLTPVGSEHETLRTVDHEVSVAIDNGFSRTEVRQTFFNPHDRDLEAIFRLPLPKSASLSEMTIFTGERELHGEVLPADEAEALYEEEKRRGQDAGLGEKNDIQSFDFHVTPVRAGDRTTIRFVYYQPLVLDTGIGRYLYPLEEGGTDDAEAMRFWTLNDAVDGRLSIDVDLRSAWPIADVRTPGFEAAAAIEEIGEDHYRIRFEREGGNLDADFVVYYRLEQGLPGRVELLTHRPDPNRPGTFLLLLTPALDLAPIERGSDYVFVLDASGSMAAKLPTLAEGVRRGLGQLDPEDRFRVVVFSDRARMFTRGWIAATPENVERVSRKLDGLQSDGGTNLHAGLAKGLQDLDDDRATSVVLVTDGVANRGLVDPLDFARLLEQNDVRVYGFLMGNSANWPLMELIAETSGGFYQTVSNQDDLVGHVVLAKEKIGHETLHGAELSIDGVDVFEVTGQAPRKIYRGQQLAIFGRYRNSGPATVRLDAALTGQDVTYRTRFDFPEVSADHPELERLWALARVEDAEALMRVGLLEESEGTGLIEAIGVEYQIVTDETSMVVLDDAAYEEHGIDRRNRDRIAIETEARARREARPIRRSRVDDADPMFGGREAPSAGSGAGAFGLWEALLLALGGGLLAGPGRSKR